MNEIDFNLLGNQAEPPSTVDTASLSTQSTPFGLLHHQNTVDIFIIRAYNLLSNGTIINSNRLQGTIESPQTTMNTPSAIITHPSVAMKAITGDDGTLKPGDFLNTNDTGKSNNDEESTTNNNANNTPDSISTFASNNTLAHNTYNFNLQLFQKISPLYTAILSNSDTDNIIDKSSSSPKSAIELFQRFVQIIKELELGFEVTPYAKYFHRLDEHLWQIKNDSELEDDQIWQAITTSIFSVYDAQSGKILSPNNIRIKKNASTLANSVVNKSMTNDNVTPTHINTNNVGNNNNSNTPSSSNSIPDSKSNGVVVSNGISADSTVTSAKKPKKKYTRRKPAATAAKVTGKKATKANAVKVGVGKVAGKNTKKGGSNTKITETMLQQQQLLKDPSQGNLVNGLFGPDGSLPQQLQRRLQSISMNRDEHLNLSRSLNGYYTQPTSPGPGLVDMAGNGAPFDFNNLVPGGNNNLLNYHLNGLVLNNMNNNNNSGNNAANFNANSIPNNNTNNVNGMNNNNGNNHWRNKPMDLNTLDENTVDELLQFNNNNTNNNNGINNSSNNNNNNNNNNNTNNTNNNAATTNISPLRRPRMDTITLETVSKQMKQTFDQVIQEKDQRIIQLERELQAERQETQWLRKMLIEDMGCVRSMLQDIKK